MPLRMTRKIRVWSSCPRRDLYVSVYSSISLFSRPPTCTRVCCALVGDEYPFSDSVLIPADIFVGMQNRARYSRRIKGVINMREYFRFTAPLSRYAAGNRIRESIAYRAKFQVEREFPIREDVGPYCRPHFHISPSSYTIARREDFLYPAVGEWREIMGPPCCDK